MCLCGGGGERGEGSGGGDKHFDFVDLKLFSFCMGESWTFENDVHTFYQRFPMFPILSQCYFVYNFYD